MSKSIREEIIRKAQENLARKEAERQRAITGETEKVYVVQQNGKQKFNAEKFAIRVILAASFVWAIIWVVYYFIYEPDPRAQRLTVVVFLLIPLNAILVYAGYLIIRIIAKSYWELVGCGWLITLVFGVLGLAGLIGVILVG